MISKSLKFVLAVCLIGFVSCKKEQPVAQDNTFHVDFEEFTLDNGLRVILHKDTSDPVVAVALTAHVGSARELEGRTGFAHLFEHLLFLESENLGKGGLDQMSARIGGSGANGSTSRDRTNYFQTVPKDALEKMIWAEADKLGYFINTVTEPVLAKEKQVVKNEKRQRVDNQPYGHTNYVIGENLYPKGHPYSWQVIGSLEDLQNATLQDVKDFYNRWYVPNNVTLTIAGDFDTEQTKAWVRKYFDEIARGEDIPEMEKQPVVLTETKKLYYEDNFARVPELTLTWPGVYEYHPDSYALEVLTTYLSEGKKAPLYKNLVETQQLTDRVDMYAYGSELAGEIALAVTAYDSISLDRVLKAVDSTFAQFEQSGIPQADLDRIKAGQETRFYNSMSSVLGKGFQLAQYAIFTGDPGYINEDIKHLLNVSTEDVMRVYNTYIKGKHYVATSFVPKGQMAFALSDSKLANVVEEQIIEGAEESFDASAEAAYKKTPSSFDRSVEPPYGESPDVTLPTVWKDSLSSGLTLYGITHTEVPLVQYQLFLKGGVSVENPEQTGVSNLLAQLLTKGTQNKTAEAFEEAVDQLGASIRANTSKEGITIRVTTLTKNFDATLALVEELLLQPRWDDKEFELLKQSTLSQLERSKAVPTSIAQNEFNKLIYGEDHILGQNTMGTEASVSAITMDDLKAYYNTYFSPSVAQLTVAGDITAQAVKDAMASLNSNWASKAVSFPDLAAPSRPDKATVYFYDVPNAKQSVLMFGYPALSSTDADYDASTVLNYRLGGGSFASQLTQELRESKGYTYGIYSDFEGGKFNGPFFIYSTVRANVTYESAALIKEIVSNYGSGYTEEDLDVTKSYLLKSGARQFETLGSKLDMLNNISRYGLADTYMKQREQLVKDITVADIKALSTQYLDTNRMLYVVVGDKATQYAKLEQLGFGKPVLLN